VPTRCNRCLSLRNMRIPEITNEHRRINMLETCAYFLEVRVEIVHV